MTAEDDAAPPVLPPHLDAALERFSAALERLRVAAGRRADAQAGLADGDLEAALMQDDRARLAAERDGALARAARLERAHAEAVGRLDRAEAAIRSVAGGLGDAQAHARVGEA